MDSNSTLITGIAPDHWPALFAALMLPLGVWFALRLARRAAANGGVRAGAFVARYEAAPFASRVTAGLLLLSGVVHLALPLGHRGEPVLSLLFLASGAAFVTLAFDVFSDKGWRRPAAVVLIGSIAAYVVLTASGKYEEPDQVGIATKLAEITALGLIMIPPLSQQRGIRRKLARPLASSAFVAVAVVAGTALWVTSLAGHNHADAAAAETSGHSHGDYAARAEAGIILQPISDAAATPEQVQAAARFADATKAGIAKYADVSVAIADGYKQDGPSVGLKRHFSNSAYKKDGRTLDPTRPEMLVYGVKDNKYVLLGAVYTMEKAGQPGADIGGPVAQWHAHNICVTVLPPAFGLVSPYGTCPLASVAVTIPQMIHVWTVDNPDGPYAHDLSDGFIRGVLSGKPQ